MGQWVWRWYPPAINNKLGQGWTGPYLVIGQRSEVNYEIQKDSDKPSVIVHVDHLKPYQGSNPPVNWLEMESEASADQSDLRLDAEEEEDSDDTDNVHSPSPNVSLTPPSPVIQKRTKYGREVKPRNVYSP